MTGLHFEAEGSVEAAIVTDPEWLAGARWGRPRAGHPEGSVAEHVAHVLANVEKHALDAPDRARLRLCAIVHDAFKYKVDNRFPKTGSNHHGHFAARFLEGFTDDRGLALVVETHDEAYNAWKQIERRNVHNAVRRAGALALRLDTELPFYLRFYRCDNGVPGKRPDPVAWFENFLRTRGFPT